MAVYTVIGYERTTRMMRVEADSEEDAIKKAMRGEYDDVYTEPGPSLMRPRWYVQGEWPYGPTTGGAGR